jgi:hypothetical protein
MTNDVKSCFVDKSEKETRQSFSCTLAELEQFIGDPAMHIFGAEFRSRENGMIRRGGRGERGITSRNGASGARALRKMWPSLAVRSRM